MARNGPLMSDVDAWPKCKCGCGEDVPAHPRNRPARGIKAGDPLVYCPGHIPNKLRANMDTEVDPITGCIYYVGRPRDRYRWIWHEGKSETAHRIAWEKANGPIPAGKLLHHRCENEGCINADHLEVMDTVEHNRVHNKAVHLNAEAQRRRREKQRREAA